MLSSELVVRGLRTLASELKYFISHIIPPSWNDPQRIAPNKARGVDPEQSLGIASQHKASSNVESMILKGLPLTKAERGTPVLSQRIAFEEG